MNASAAEISEYNVIVENTSRYSGDCPCLKIPKM